MRELRVEDWANALGLKKRGVQYSGPCPLCGGRDRFHVQEVGGKTLVGCRGCIDGEDPSLRRSRYIKIIEQVFGKRKRLTPLPSAKRKQYEEGRKKKNEDNWKKVAARAKQMLSRCKLDVHPYMENKGFPEHQVLICDGSVFVPIRDAQGQLISAQLIKEWGEKRFLAGGRVKGGRFVIGRGREPWTVEGLATGYSVYYALKRLERDVRVVVAFSAGNIPNVAKRGFVICDHDENGVGEKHAKKTKLPYWQPPEKGDANDYHQTYGLDILASDLRYFIMRTKRKKRV